MAALATIPMASLVILCTIIVIMMRQTCLENGRQCCLIPDRRPQIDSYDKDVDDNDHLVVGTAVIP